MDFIKKNILSLIIIFLLFILLLLNIFSKPVGEEISYNQLKDYANELRTKGLYMDAINTYEQFLKSSTLSKKIRVNIHYFIGDIYRENLKDFDKALAHFIKIKYINPDSPLMQNINQKIVECLENSGRSREAQLALQESTALNQKNSSKESTTILAKIDSDMVTLKDFNDWYSQLPDEIKKEYISPEKKRLLLQQYISQELMYRMAMRKGYQNSPDVLQKSYEIKKNIMVQKLMQEELLGKINITQKDLELFYKANKEKYKQPLNQIYQTVYQDFMGEKVQEKSQEMLQQMIKANNVQIFDGNLK